MPPTVFPSVEIVAYLALFAGVGVLFLFVNLVVGYLVRPADPHAEKIEIYECGEPTIGSSFVQFDLRFYVVAPLFIIFDVEVAFFFPWAVVFGKSTNLMDPDVRVVATQSDGSLAFAPAADGEPVAERLYQELGVRAPTVSSAVPASLRAQVPEGLDAATSAERVAHAGARQLALVTIFDIVVFFAVLLVGFAYVWRRGDLDWVRAMSEDVAERRRESTRSEGPSRSSDEPVLSA